MRLLCFLICLFSTPLMTLAQPADTLSPDALFRQNPQLAALSQRGTHYLVLDRNSALGFQRLRFFTGQTLSFRYADGHRYKNRLRAISDTSFALVVENPNNFLDELRHFRLDRVERVFTTRRLPFISQGTYMLPLAGGVFLLADVTNSGFVNTGALFTSGALALLGGVCYRLTHGRISINQANRLRALPIR